MTGEEPTGPGGGEGNGGPLPFDTSKAHQIRVDDFMLGGKDNHAADRARNARGGAGLAVRPEPAQQLEPHEDAKAVPGGGEVAATRPATCSGPSTRQRKSWSGLPSERAGLKGGFTQPPF